MSVLKINKVIELSEQIGEGNPLEVLFDEEVGRRKHKLAREIANLIEVETDKAKEVVVERMGEKKFCELADALRAHAMSALISNGHGFSLLESSISGDLKAFSDTFVFSVLGMLMSDEVI